jgi:predicted ArsR family transcriptional regulator
MVAGPQFVNKHIGKLDTSRWALHIAGPSKGGSGMADEAWRKRLLGSTRGQLVALLRRSAQTVNDLAVRVGLTANGVRLHLSGLERDGLVEASGTRREWTGKPAVLYRATPAAEVLFPKPYAEVLGQLLAVLKEKTSPEQLDAVVREAGVRLADGAPAATGTRRERYEHAARVLTSLGGLAEVQESEGDVLLQGYSCPLGAVTSEHPETCRLAESLVSELVGERVQECCDRGDRPRCAFRPVAEA